MEQKVKYLCEQLQRFSQVDQSNLSQDQDIWFFHGWVAELAVLNLKEIIVFWQGLGEAEAYRRGVTKEMIQWITRDIEQCLVNAQQCFEEAKTNPDSNRSQGSLNAFLETVTRLSDLRTRLTIGKS